MSHLPSTTHASVKHALFSKHSLSSLFAKDVIHDSLIQVKEDSQLSLLKNLSSLKGGKQSPSLLPPRVIVGVPHRHIQGAFCGTLTAPNSLFPRHLPINPRWLSRVF